MYKQEREHLISEVTQCYFENKPDHPAMNRLMGKTLYDIIIGTNATTMATWRTSYDLILKYLSPSLITSYLGLSSTKIGLELVYSDKPMEKCFTPLFVVICCLLISSGFLGLKADQEYDQDPVKGDKNLFIHYVMQLWSSPIS